MIDLLCYNICSGHTEIIHQWPNETAQEVISKFISWEVDQDKSAEHVYYDRKSDEDQG